MAYMYLQKKSYMYISNMLNEKVGCFFLILGKIFTDLLPYFDQYTRVLQIYYFTPFSVFFSLENKSNDEQVFILLYHHVHILNLTIARENVHNLCAYKLNV